MKLNLSAKFLVIIFTAFLVAGVSIVFLTRSIVVDITMKEMEKRGLSLSRNIANYAQNMILTEQYIELSNVLSDLKNTERDVMYAYILNNKKEIISHTFIDGVPAELIRTNEDRGIGEYDIKLFNDGKNYFYDAGSLVLGGRLGSVHVGLSTTGTMQKISDTVLRMSLIVLFICLISLSVLYFFVKKLIGPIAQLTMIANNISMGNYSIRPQISTGDEIETLGRSFGEMIDKVHESQSSLEEKISSRTADLNLKIEELEKLNKYMVGRELRMSELKCELEELKAKEAGK